MDDREPRPPRRASSRRQPAPKHSRPLIDTEKIYRDLTLLLYPSILGGIIYKFLDLTQVSQPFGRDQIFAALLLSSITIHYIVDYLYTLYVDRYNLASFILDTAVLSILYYTSTLIDFHSGICDTRTAALMFSITYALFVSIDVMLGDFDINMLKIIVPEAMISAVFLVIYDEDRNISPAMLAATITIASTILFHVGPKPLVRDRV